MEVNRPMKGPVHSTDTYTYVILGLRSSAPLPIWISNLLSYSHSASWSGQFIMGKMRAGLEKIAKEMRNAQQSEGHRPAC